MILDTTSKVIEIILGEAKTTTDCDFNIDYADTVSGSTFVPGSSPGVTNGVTLVTALAAPAASAQRNVKFISVYNNDTVNHNVTVRSYDGANRRIYVKAAITPGQVLSWMQGAGWSIVAAAPGQIIGTGTNDDAAAGNLGELSNNLATGVALTSGVATNVNSRTLGPGDWYVRGGLALTAGVTTNVTITIGWLSEVSATQPTPPNEGAMYRSEFSGLVGPLEIFPVGIKRVSVAAGATKIIYLGTRALFTVSTMSADGFIEAWRRR